MFGFLVLSFCVYSSCFAVNLMLLFLRLRRISSGRSPISNQLHRGSFLVSSSGSSPSDSLSASLDLFPHYSSGPTSHCVRINAFPPPLPPHLAPPYTPHQPAQIVIHAMKYLLNISILWFKSRGSIMPEAAFNTFFHEAFSPKF